MSPYQYSSLRGAEIRLMTLLPGNFSDGISILLTKAQLPTWPSVDVKHESTTPEGQPQESGKSVYTALSYVWGPVEDPSSLVVKGQPEEGTISITQNLDLALRHLRKHDQQRVLWVDAVCINQDDLAERNSQVSLMARLYQRAHRIVVWLGPEKDDGEFALTFLDSWGSKVDIDWVNNIVSPLATLDDPFDLNQLEVLDQRKSWAIYHLLNRQYFERLWIQQEILTSRPTIIKCGNAEFPSSTLMNAIYLTHRGRFWPDLPAVETTRFLERRNLIYGLTVSFATTRTLERLRYDLRGRQWSEPVDAIYASLSLLTPFEQRLDIIPDYRIPPAKVFQDVATKLIKATRNLSLLAGCELSSKVLPELPSWVPDWSSQINVSPIYAHWHAAAWVSAQVSFEEGGNLLRAAGIQKASVQDKDNLDFAAQNGTLLYSGVAQVMRGLLPDNLSSSYIGGGDMCQAYTQTFSTDYFAERFTEDRKTPTLEEAKAFIRQLKSVPTNLEIPEFLRDYKACSMGHFLSAAMELFPGRSFFTTQEGYIGLGPCDVQPDDALFVILGCRIPVLLRPVKETNASRWQIVGACYVPGLMNGEAVYGVSLEHMSPVATALQRNVFRMGLRDKRSGIINSDCLLLLESFGIQAEEKFENDYQVRDVTSETLRGRGVNVEMIEIV